MKIQKRTAEQFTQQKGLYTKIASMVLFPIHERIKGHDTIDIYRFLQSTQFLTRDELIELQCQKLKNLLIYASENVPYYKKIFREWNIDASSINNIDDLSSLPLLTKDDIRTNLNHLKSIKSSRLVISTTSGSTGMPLKFFIGKKRASYDVAAKMRAHGWWGIEIGDPEIVIWSSVQDLPNITFLKSLRDKIFRSKLVPVRDLSSETMQKIAEEIEQRNPTHIFGYTAAIISLARYLIEKKQCALSERLSVVFVTSEYLSEDNRKLIEDAFGCPVANEYGARDAGFIAHECQFGGMHITMEEVIVEILDEKNKPVSTGNVGEVVITNLASHDFPFIRYKTGDMASLSADNCRCGRGLLLIDKIVGRSNDVLLSVDGKRLHYTAVTHVMRKLDSVREFQITQEARNHIRIRVVPEGILGEGTLITIKNEMRKKLGEEMMIDIVQSDSIPLGKNGKYRHVINRVITPDNDIEA